MLVTTVDGIAIEFHSIFFLL